MDVGLNKLQISLNKLQTLQTEKHKDISQTHSDYCKNTKSYIAFSKCPDNCTQQAWSSSFVCIVFFFFPLT